MEIITISDDDFTDYKPKLTLCNKLHSFLNYTTIFNVLATLCAILIILSILYFSKDYIRALLFWIENQNPFVIFLIFIVLFTIVSFPVTIGYLFLIIASGYLFGVGRGFLTVVVSANIGVAIAHYTIRFVHSKYPVKIISKNETARAILRVISGPQSFKVVLFARLTPIPFGLQNTIFALSTVSGRRFHVATFLGLLPAQTINVYLGSTLRSMHDVLSNKHTATTGYIVFAFQLIIGVSLMMWVIVKARSELTQALFQAEMAAHGCSRSSSSSSISDSGIVISGYLPS